MSTFKDVPIKNVQDYWNARPCNIRHSPKPIGTKEYFDEVEVRKYAVEPHIPQFADFPSWKGKRVLEIGCGIGTDTINFARAGAKVTAVDLSKESLELAQKRASVFNLADRIQFFCGNSEELDQFVPVDKYDLVYSFGVIHHTPHPERVIKCIRKFMNADSELRIMLYSKASYKLFWIMKEECVWDMGRLDELIARNSEAQTGCPVTYSYTFNEVRSLLSDFQIIEMQKAHIFTWDIEAYKRYEFKKDAIWANVSDEQIAELEKELGWHLLTRARLAV
ncbi:MAG: methyltransferase type 12 [Desulfobacterales bacterium CG23_combo_of_CG06-09_8_20_14_all_51_8]|nr:MAG: methyltransferase type 12 [Desulfobacterales bacterium CG23_combo_of_CG06-09_8_20_14_all_51_8]